MEARVLWAILLLGTATPAAAVSIDFDSDPSGPKANGWTSDDSAVASFSMDIAASGLLVGVIGSSQALVADEFGDALRITFSSPIDSISMSVGNNSGLPSTTYRIEVFDGAVSVGSASIADDGNGIFLDQILSFSGATFDSALVETLSVGSRFNAAEIIDNLQFHVVPEPGTALVLATGLLGLAVHQRRH